MVACSTLFFLPTAPNQRHPFLDLRKKRATPPHLALCCRFPHPLQNRMPRVQVLLPLPKKSGIASAVPDFFVSVRQDLATRCARRPACGACRGVSERQWRSVANRPRRQPRPSPSLDFLLAFQVFPSGFTRSQLFPSSPAPRTHPVSPFSG